MRKWRIRDIVCSSLILFHFKRIRLIEEFLQRHNMTIRWLSIVKTQQSKNPALVSPNRKPVKIEGALRNVSLCREKVSNLHNLLDLKFTPNCYEEHRKLF